MFSASNTCILSAQKVNGFYVLLRINGINRPIIVTKTLCFF